MNTLPAKYKILCIGDSDLIRKKTMNRLWKEQVICNVASFQYKKSDRN
jgi:hypothetical protein